MIKRIIKFFLHFCPIWSRVLPSVTFCSFSLNFKREISLFTCVYMVNLDPDFNIGGRGQINIEQPNFVRAAGLEE